MNRFHLTEVLEATLKQALAQRNSCGFMLVTIDNLARINEAYGFDVADEAIGAVAKRLRAKMRGGDQLGRVSGNKFGVILNNCTPEDIEKAAERLVAGVRDHIICTGAGPVAVTVTIRGVTAPRHASNVQEILARAQEMLDRAKAKRPGSYQIYRPNVERETLRRENVRAADEIVTALNERRILLAFEPVVETASRKPAFHECLMRIRRSDGALVPASAVVPVAERLGLVRLLDHRVLELLVSEMSAVPGLIASVNVAPASTTAPDWWSTLGALLRANAGVAERLIVEITEPAAIHDIDDTRGFVSCVKDLGCRIAIDDFGSGYTSFRNLRKLGVDILKIDGAFVQNLMRTGDDRAFAQALVDLANRLGLKTVAEWVQDEDSAQLLAEWDCDYLQGALIGLAAVERPWGGAAPADRRKTARACRRYRPLLVLVADAIDALLHLVDLALEIFDVTGRLRSLVPFSGALARLTLTRERGEHRKCALEHLHVQAHLLLDRTETAHAECRRSLFAEFGLFLGERVDRHFEVARHHHLHAVAVEADQLAQEVDGKEVLAALLVLLLENDLGEHRAGDVLVGLGVIDHEILAGLHHDSEALERHIGAGAGIVEPPVGVLLDSDRLVGFGHRTSRFLCLPNARLSGFLTPGHLIVQRPDPPRPRNRRKTEIFLRCGEGRIIWTVQGLTGYRKG